ncbi:hypothetical protein L3Q65_18315 [Amycolatopsis sp. FU40]|nr:hypothetical protein L3Q65_18315 [Amycolatopsis sp. FU40]
MRDLVVLVDFRFGVGGPPELCLVQERPVRRSLGHRPQRRLQLVEPVRQAAGVLRVRGEGLRRGLRHVRQRLDPRLRGVRAAAGPGRFHARHQLLHATADLRVLLSQFRGLVGAAVPVRRALARHDLLDQFRLGHGLLAEVALEQIAEPSADVAGPVSDPLDGAFDGVPDGFRRVAQDIEDRHHEPALCFRFVITRWAATFAT